MRKSLVICALAGLAGSPAHAAEKTVDADLLEFLGSLDSDEAGWHDYLEQGVVKAAGKAPVKEPVKAPAAASPDKQVKSK